MLVPAIPLHDLVLVMQEGLGGCGVGTWQGVGSPHSGLWGLPGVVTKEDLGVWSSPVAAAALGGSGVCEEGQGEALGTGHCPLCGLGLRVDKVHPGSSREPTRGSAGIIDGSPSTSEQSLMLALFC